jgi:hypothetical protein
LPKKKGDKTNARKKSRGVEIAACSQFEWNSVGTGTALSTDMNKAQTERRSLDKYVRWKWDFIKKYTVRC